MLFGAALTACRDHIADPVSVRVRPSRLRANAGPFTPGPCSVQFPEQPASSPFGVGANLWSNRNSNYPPDPVSTATYGQIATLYRQANAGWVRVDFDWGREIGTSSDTNDLHWAAIDTTVQQAWCRGVNILGVLAYTPGWATQRLVGVVPDSERFTYLPDDMQHWEAFVRRAVNRYPQIRYWSIWNEPNSTGYFRGGRNVPSELVDDYNRLLGAAAPHIVNNVDGRGRRYLVALELGGSEQAASAPWFQGVLGGPHAASIDVVSYHHYGSAVDIKNRLYSIATDNGPAIPGGWRWPIWLGEAGPIGCNTTPKDQRPGLGYCVGTDSSYIDDAFQASHVRGVLSAMLLAPSTSASAAWWQKTFYWHSHTQVVQNNVGDDYGLLAGARQNSLRGRPGFTAFATAAGPLGITGPASSSGTGGAVVTAVPKVPDTYHYVWEYRWCYNSPDPWACDYNWYWYTEGPDATVNPAIYPDDYWLDLRVRQYAWNGGPHIGSASHRVLGPCGVPRARCTPARSVYAASGSATTRLTTSAAPATAGTTAERQSPADTTAAQPHPVRIPAGAEPRSAERMRGRAGRGNA